GKCREGGRTEGSEGLGGRHPVGALPVSENLDQVVDGVVLHPQTSARLMPILLLDAPTGNLIGFTARPRPSGKRVFVGRPVVVPRIDLGAVLEDADTVLAAVGVLPGLVGVALLYAPDRGRVGHADAAAAPGAGPRDSDDLNRGSPLLDGDGVACDLPGERD